MIEWRDVVGYEGLYQVSNKGDVRNAVTHKILKQAIDKYGYCKVGLFKNKKQKEGKVHRLVAMAFIPNPENKPCINHLNTKRNDNRVENLEWCTWKENSNHEPTRKHISESKMGEKNHNYHRIFTEKERENISKAHKGLFVGEKNPMYGKCGEDNPNYNRAGQAVKRISIETGEILEIYPSKAIAARAVKGHITNISKCCKDNTKTCAGFRWELV
ncbi:MAG: HNH endonuclease [Prevotellaceae bacterium]|nr:HNH endonuclease [Candidatus Faecinaster equi]